MTTFPVPIYTTAAQKRATICTPSTAIHTAIPAPTACCTERRSYVLPDIIARVARFRNAVPARITMNGDAQSALLENIVQPEFLREQIAQREPIAAAPAAHLRAVAPVALEMQQPAAQVKHPFRHVYAKLDMAETQHQPAVAVQHVQPGIINQAMEIHRALPPASDITSAQPRQHRSRRVHHGVQIQRQPARAQHQRAHVFAKAVIDLTAQHVQHVPPELTNHLHQMQQAVQRPASDITSAQPQQHHNRRVHHGVQIQQQPARAQHLLVHAYAKPDIY